MKVLFVIIFAVGSASALGSGPYLPSGWRPQGPSFYLPSEVAKPSDSPLKENLLQETEASGSDALREYGPPKVEEVVQFSGNQGLPDVATEQTFFVQSLATQELESTAELSTYAEANTEQVATIVEEVATPTEAAATVTEVAATATEAAATVTEAAAIATEAAATATEVQAELSVEEQTATILSESQPTFETIPLESLAEIVEQTSEAVLETTEGVAVDEIAPTAVANQEQTVASTSVSQEESVVPTVLAQEEAVPTVLAKEEVVVPTAAFEQIVVENVAEGVNNIAEALVNLEKEVKAAQALETAVEIKQEISGTLQQAPEGFLEYGPPGFREYGPPKQEDLARSTAVVEVAPTSTFENNEVRRRRFSPKFKSHKKH